MWLWNVWTQLLRKQHGSGRDVSLSLSDMMLCVRKPQLVVTKGNFRCGECSQTVNTSGHRLSLPIGQKTNSTEAPQLCEPTLTWNPPPYVRLLQLLVDWLHFMTVAPAFFLCSWRWAECWSCSLSRAAGTMLRCFVHTSYDQITYRALLQPLS